MRTERLTVANNHINDLNEMFGFTKIIECDIDDMGIVLKVQGDPEIFSSRLESLSEMGYNTAMGDVAEVYSKDEYGSATVVTRRFDRPNMLTIGVIV